MAEFRISVDLSNRIAASRVVDRAVFPLLHQAVRVIAEHTMLNWREAVLRARLWQGEKDAYAGVEYVTEIPQLALHTLVSGNEPKKATEEVVDRAIQLFRHSNWPQVATQKTGLLHRERLPL